VDFYTSVLNRTTATVLAQLRKNSHGLNTFVDCSQTTSKRRCLYVQQRTIFGALGSVIINSTDFHPGHLMAQMKPTALIHALSHYQGKKDKSSRCISHSSNTTALSVPVRQVLVSILSEDCDKDGLTPPSSGSFTSIPPMWQPLISRFYRRHPERDIPKLTKPRLRILLLDILLEFIKIDEIVNENECLWGLAPFVCDYFMSRYVDRDVVGACLTSLIESLHTYQSDPRAKFFASACGLMTPHISYDMFLYYLQALEHILYGQMKIYEPENSLEERRDGACPVPRSVALAATSILFSSSLSKTELKILRERIEKAPALKEAPANQEIEIEIDQILVIYLEEWETLEAKLDEVNTLLYDTVHYTDQKRKKNIHPIYIAISPLISTQ
jgi:hypothetical protein